MQMVMLVFRSSLTERVHELLHKCDVHAFTEVSGAVGHGETGSATGLKFSAGTNSVILVGLDDTALAGITKAVKEWYQDHANHPGWEKPSIRVFTWPCHQIV